MNSSKRSDRAVSITMSDRLGEWRRLVDCCGRRPTRKRVHALRVVTLRLQAELDIHLADLPRASHQAQTILEFSRQGEKLRGVLGPVREFDVWISKLQGLRASFAESAAGYVPQTTRECIRQIERLELRLKEKRRRLEKKLVVAIGKRKGDFAAAADEIDLSMDEPAGDAGVDAVSVIRTRFAEVAKDFPAFDAENLHDFRKRIKMVRYLAEIHAADPACGRIAAQMKKLQSAIGEWHDWQALAREALRGHRVKSKDLAELLDSVAAESLESALATCHSITARLIGERTAPAEASHVLGRKLPTRSNQDSSEAAGRKLA